MKKSLLTGALALSLLLGNVGTALAAEATPLAAEVIATPADSVNVMYEELSATETGNVFVITENADGAASAEATVKFSTLQAYTFESYQAEIDQTQAALALAVETGQTTAEEAAKILAQMADNLQQIKDGTLSIYYAQMEDANGEPAGKLSIVSVKDTVTNAQFSDTAFTITTH